MIFLMMGFTLQVDKTDVKKPFEPTVSKYIVLLLLTTKSLVKKYDKFQILNTNKYLKWKRNK